MKKVLLMKRGGMEGLGDGEMGRLLNRGEIGRVELKRC